MSAIGHIRLQMLVFFVLEQVPGGCLRSKDGRMADSILLGC
jgi:hypothetical protein